MPCQQAKSAGRWRQVRRQPMPAHLASAGPDRRSTGAVVEHRIPVNAGSIDMLHQLGQRSPGHPVWLRINPGFGHGHSNKTNTGGEHSKHGIWHTELPAALAVIGQHGLQLVGLHMHIGSGVDYSHLEQVCQAMVDLVKTSGANVQALPQAAACPSLSARWRPHRHRALFQPVGCGAQSGGATPGPCRAPGD